MTALTSTNGNHPHNQDPPGKDGREVPGDDVRGRSADEPVAVALARVRVEQARAEVRREVRAADRVERVELRRARRQERHDRGAQRRGWRRARRARWAAGSGMVARRLRPVLPISLVTGLAMYGQIGYAVAEIAPVSWPLAVRLLLAVALAVAVESIALTVQWHAHDALLGGHTLTAARQRRVSYLLAAGVAGINYSHFAGPGWAPTPAAVCFALFSASGPWLWGLHTRRAQRVQLSREGQLDTGGAVFRAERYRWFPIRTLLALRWSIDHGVTDPAAAWAGYHVERGAARTTRAAARTARRTARAAARSGARVPERGARPAEQPLSPPAPPDEGGLPDRRGLVDTSRIEHLIADLRAGAGRPGRRYSRDEIRKIYGIGDSKARLAMRYLAWSPRTTEPGGPARQAPAAGATRTAPGNPVATTAAATPEVAR